MAEFGRKARVMGDAVPEAEGAIELQPITFPVLKIIQQSQSIHGLKHSEYTRYRYCPPPFDAGHGLILQYNSYYVCTVGNTVLEDYIESIKG